MSDKLPAKRVLLVEDEVLVAALAAEALHELGFEVIEAGTAKAALELAVQGIADFDFAIVDLGLPDRAGDELVADLRALRSDLPIIIATGYGDAALRGRLQNQPHLVILGKPYDWVRFRAAIDALKAG